MTLDLILLLISVGMVGGFLAGLLGIGGGLVVVPVITYVLHSQFGDLSHIQHMALGTSFAVMVFTASSNTLAQQKLKAIRWDIFRLIIPGIIGGTWLGSLLASKMPAQWLTSLFIGFMCFLIIQTLLGKAKSAQEGAEQIKKLPTIIAGAVIGIISSMLGIAGGTITVPYLLRTHLPIRQAVGTSALIGLPIALTGAISYIMTGYHQAGLPEYTLGFIYLPGFLVLAICTTLFAPIGARVSSKIDGRYLKMIFVLLLLSIVISMVYRLWAA